MNWELIQSKLGGYYQQLNLGSKHLEIGAYYEFDKTEPKYYWWKVVAPNETSSGIANSEAGAKVRAIEVAHA